VARANALQSKTQGADADAARVRALAAYQDFLTLWKNADPDILLKEAKARVREAAIAEKTFLLACCLAIGVVTRRLHSEPQVNE